MTETTPASQMLRVPTVLVESVKELSRLHRQGHTNVILSGLQELIAKLDSTDITTASTFDSVLISELLSRLNQVETRVAILEEELQAHKTINTTLHEESTTNLPGEQTNTTGDLSGNEPVAIAPNEQEDITIKELAERLNMSRQAVEQREQQGKLKNLGWQRVPGTGTNRNNPRKYRRIKN